MSDASPLQGADPAWLHALRNAVNAASVAVAAARSALDSGDPTRAGFFLDESAGACERASKLLHTHGACSDTSALDRGEGIPEQVRS